MMNLRNMSIRRKQVLVMLLTSTVALLLACASFMIYEARSFRAGMTDHLSSLAGVIGNNLTAAIDFNDQVAAWETLTALRSEPGVLHAHVRTRDGEEFAAYLREGAEMPADITSSAGDEVFVNGHLHLFRPITQGDEQVGTIELVAGLDELNSRLWRYAGLAGLVFVASLLVTVLMSARLQRLISDPVLHLARVARSVATDKNYSLRVEKRSTDEIGQLVENFNEMLCQIELRDDALQTARDSLERRVRERTAELARSVSLLNATIDSTADGILAVDLEGRLLSFNRQFITMWGFPADLVRRRDAAGMIAFAATLVRDPDAFLKRVRESQAQPKTEVFTEIELRDGRVFERYSRPQYIADECSGYVLNFRDVTERRRAEAEVAFERDLLRGLLDSSPDAIYMKDRESRFIRCSRAMCGLFGVKSPEDLIGKRDADFFAGDHAQEALADEQRIIATGEPVVGKLEKEAWPDGRITWALTSKMALRDHVGAIIGTVGVSKDITAMKEAEAELEAVHKKLLDTSRQAGMAEVATGVLHNVGNVLNSVNVSATIVADRMQRSEVGNLARVCDLLRQHQTDLGGFFGRDPRGAKVPGFLETLSDHLAAERKEVVREVEQLRKNVEHIKEIVAMQQAYAKVSGIIDSVPVVDLVEDAIRMNVGALSRHDVKLVRDFQFTPTIAVEKHKVLQILVNLIRNAKYACDDSGRSDKTLTVRIAGNERSVQIAVIDNGVGIPGENLTRIFSHGFTTRKEGHGFGLHSGALAAKEMGGTLTAHSEGPGTGAMFVLELPARQEALVA